jgi:PilZ domain-containing protein
MNSAAQQIDPTPDGRQQPRTHLFVAATLYADRGSIPVNIRNMSLTGALVEADDLPDVGTRVSLSRAQLHAIGSVAWRAGRRAGLKFEAAVCVPDWMARQGTAGQQRVDGLLAIIRSEAPHAAAEADEATRPTSIQAELGQLRAELVEMERALIADVILVATHPEIQTFDISLQRIDRILARLRSEG